MSQASPMSMPRRLAYVKQPEPIITPIASAWGVAALAALAADELQRDTPAYSDAFTAALRALLVERSVSLWREAKQIAGLSSALAELEGARWGDE